MGEIDLENDQIHGSFLCVLNGYFPKGVDILIANNLCHVLPLQITEYKTTEHAMIVIHVVLPELVDNEDEPKEQTDNLDTSMLFNVKDHITLVRESFDSF